MLPIRLLSSRTALAAALCVSISCAAQAQAPATKPAAAAAAPAANPSTVVVSGPAGKVTQSELEAMVNEVVPPAQRASFWSQPQTVDRFARSLYNQRALSQQALAGGVDKTRAGAEYLELVRERALSKLWLDQKVQGAAPDPKAVAEFARSEYRAHPERFAIPEQVQVRHILLPLAPDGSDDAGFMRQCAQVTGLLAGLLTEHGGSISAEHGIGLVKKPWLGSTRSAEEIALMRGMRAVFDPAGILNPGKLFD